MSEIRALGNGRFLVSRDGATAVAFAVWGDTGTWVFLDGHAVLVSDVPGAAPAAGGARRRTADPSSLAAPMPATVVAINVTAGQAVAAGDVLILLEAMTMELAITAPRDGTVKRLACKAGDLVQAGVPLVELET